MSAKPTEPDLLPLLTERCARSPIPGGCHCWLRSVRLDGPAVCHWCGRTCDPIADLGDPPRAERRRRARAEPDPSGDLFA